MNGIVSFIILMMRTYKPIRFVYWWKIMKLKYNQYSLISNSGTTNPQTTYSVHGPPPPHSVQQYGGHDIANYYKWVSAAGWVCRYVSILDPTSVGCWELCQLTSHSLPTPLCGTYTPLLIQPLSLSLSLHPLLSCLIPSLFHIHPTTPPPFTTNLVPDSLM
jgi:hypothetical protein